MDNNKFFKLVWRINAVLMLLVLLLVIFRLVDDQIDRWRCSSESAFRPYNMATYETVQDGKGTVEMHWGYGGLREVPAEFRFIIPLWSDTASDVKYATRNLLLVDADLGHRWLLPRDDHIIWHYEHLVTEDDSGVLAIMYEISECDSSDCADWSDKSIYLSRSDGSELTQVIPEIDRRIDQAMLGDDHLVIFFVKDGVAHAAKVSLADLAVIKIEALPPVK